MRELVYDVAVSLDGFIAGAGGDVSSFLYEGPHVVDYNARLAGYETVVMGRATYELGYAFGLAPGARAYPHMRHLIFSTTLRLPGDAVEVTGEAPAKRLAELKRGPGGPIYLAGGGALAGALYAAGAIDRLVLKVNPIVLARGVALFGGQSGRVAARLDATRRYDNGVILAEYSLTAPA
jgi:dihydrofolate reductase